jgi:hypothetical protein
VRAVECSHRFHAAQSQSLRLNILHNNVIGRQAADALE